jgi:ATP-dependent protease HslVU (ClpYQ) peptidase subunit
MNKRIKTNKLKLNHETVRTLGNKQLIAVAGGTGDYFSVISNCIFNECVEK